MQNVFNKNLFLHQGWSSAYSIESVIVQISATLVKGKARINFKENEKVCSHTLLGATAASAASLIFINT